MLRKYLIIILISGAFIVIGYWAFKNYDLNPRYKIGESIDSLNGVYVFFNGGINNASGRNLTSDNYNLGLKYQCVEFVKRYYYEHLNHKMPESYGHAKDFFNSSIADGKLNTQRNLLQYTNPSQSKPKADDLIIFSGTTYNPYGHVAIITKVEDSRIEIIQQNSGTFGNSREVFELECKNNKWLIFDDNILGWLRKK